MLRSIFYIYRLYLKYGKHLFQYNTIVSVQAVGVLVRLSFGNTDDFVRMQQREKMGAYGHTRKDTLRRSTAATMKALWNVGENIFEWNEVST